MPIQSAPGDWRGEPVRRQAKQTKEETLTTTDIDLAYAPAWKLRDLIASRKLSPTELTAFALRRAEALNPRLSAFLTITGDMALEQAKDAEKAVMRGARLGPLHGIPISIKDLEAVKGVRLTSGSLLHSEDTADGDALCVERIKAAGAIIIGKTNTPEYGAAGTTENLLGEPCRNPWDLQRTPGGSSGGAAASVVAGVTAIAQGSDGGGSVRIPASFSGIYGIKPTQGRAPRRRAGVYSYFPLNNSSVGPMSRDVRDSAVLLNVMSGPHPEAEAGTISSQPPDFTLALGRGVKGLRIAWSKDMGGAPVDPEVVEVCSKAAAVFQELGAHVEQVEYRPDDPHAVFENFVTFSAAKTYATHPDALVHRGRLTDYFTAALERGRAVTGEQFFNAVSHIGRYKAYTAEFFSKHDLLLTPTLAVAAFPVGHPPEFIGGKKVFSTRLGFYPFTYPFNVTGNPAASIPCGFTEQGLPVGLQVVGKCEDETTVIAASAAFERVRPWAGRRPPID